VTAPEVASAAQEQAGAVAGSAKEQAASVAQTATSAAGDVTGTAKEQVGNVVGETVQQARDLSGQVKEQVGTQVTAQTEKLTGSLRQIGAQISDGDTSGIVGQVLGEVGQRVQTLADRLEQTGPQGLLEEVRDYARRSPGTFLLGAAIAGLVTGRLVKGMTAQDQPALPSGPTGPAGLTGTAAGDPLAGLVQPGVGVTTDEVLTTDVGYAPPPSGVPSYDPAAPAYDPTVGASPYPATEPTPYDTGATYGTPTYGTRGAL
jgi:uncharacterized protein YjbJ (UPF0337 family)